MNQNAELLRAIKRTADAFAGTEAYNTGLQHIETLLKAHRAEIEASRRLVAAANKLDTLIRQTEAF